MALGLSSPVKAEALQYQDFVNLVSACALETSYDFEKRGAVARLQNELSLQPLRQNDETEFAAASLHAGLTGPFSSPENLTSEALGKFFSDDAVSKRWYDRIHERNEGELISTEPPLLFREFAMLDSEERERSFWWFNGGQRMPVKFGLSSLSRSAFPVCTVANIPKNWATALLSDQELRFGASKAKNYEHFTAKIDTSPSILNSLFHSATGRKPEHDMLHAEINLMQFPDFLPEGSNSSPWVLTVKTIPTL
ncbi:hypothetical protein K3555_03630 [Leisingera sp. M527]|uniref:hypothetical protein n=1 Tax=Leisingera sp. M527 TaxID=2867014 RepID=UPI0021A5C846|nr:hypothetical protein [Leisingera sp. M527]UWQ33621.1 hypothetical protein K3555_03630 [Leisingera sp. M527]